MQFTCSSNYTAKLNEVVNFANEHEDHYICVFISSKKQSFYAMKELERKLNEALCTVDVIHVHGSLDKSEKYWFIGLFCDQVNVDDLRARILLTTPAANVGIDNKLVKFVQALGFPRDLCTFFQQRGRTGRDNEMLCLCLQLGSVASYVSSVFQIHISNDDAELDDEDDQMKSVVGINSAMSPATKRNYAHGERVTRNKFTKCMKQQYLHRARRELKEVLRYFCLNCGCQHARGEWYLACGGLDKYPGPYRWEPCATKCPICTGAWGKIFVRVDKDEVVRFLQSEHALRCIPLYAKRDNIVDTLWKGEGWRLEKIYRRKTVSKFNVDALFLQLIATEIIEIRNTQAGLQWVFGRVPDLNNARESILKYTMNTYWTGIDIF